MPLQEKTQTDGTVIYGAGAYECDYTAQNETETVIENTLDATSLVVTKQWKNDQDNLYQTRPDSLTFKLQKRSVRVQNETGKASGEKLDEISEKELSDWADVLDASGKPYTFTISAKENWTKTLEDLPTAEVVVEDSRSYTVYSLYFRAVEVPVPNYQDTTDYSLDSNDHTYNTDKLCNESKITNELILDQPAKSVTVTKIWRRVEGQEANAVFELLYRTKEESSWHCYGDQELKNASGTDAQITDGTDWTKHTGTDNQSRHCLLQQVSSDRAGTAVVTWSDLPKYDKAGKELVYKVIEHPVAGYKTEVSFGNKTDASSGTEAEDTSAYPTEYTFTNIELQNYSVTKIWQNTEYAEKTANGYTAVFQLQRKLENETDWEAVEGCGQITLTSEFANDHTQKAAWHHLPKYTADGRQIIYRAVEILINGKNAADGTNGSYVVSYQYRGENSEREDPRFQDTETIAINRMVYGFVNLSKKAAYLAPNVTENGSLKGIRFNIYQVNPDTKKESLYVSGVVTDKDGNLIHDEAGRYGEEKKYLISGTYILKEAQTGSDYSLWDKGISFTIDGKAEDQEGVRTNTGEHGTAWISTESMSSDQGLHLKVTYLAPECIEHSFNDQCTGKRADDSAVNLESRGVLTFTKTGKENTSLDTHEGAKGESSAYFGVYLEAECKTQVAGMVPSSDRTTMILTDQAQDGTKLSGQKNGNGVPYLRAYTSSDKAYRNYPFTLLSGTYYIRELTAPAGYRLDTRVRKAVVQKITGIRLDTDLSAVYPGNRAQIMELDAENGTADYRWSNEPNAVTIYKMDQYGRKVPLGESGYLELKIGEDSDGSTFPSGEKIIRLYQDENRPATKTDGTTPVSSISYDAKNGSWTIIGLFDINRTYTLSEPMKSVHENYVVAKSVIFTMNADGKIQTETVVSDHPLSADGSNYENTCLPDSNNNVIVMRDVARYLKDLVLKKIASDTETVLPNISFELYRYDGKDADGNLTGVQSVLKTGVYLTTDAQGRIELGAQDTLNVLTGGALKYGLEIGTYYWKEIERGASDQYRLGENIYFEIRSEADGTAEDYSDYAQVIYDTSDSSHVQADGKTVIVKNDPVITIVKTLELTKTDSEASETTLANAKFVLTYQSINHDHAGSVTGGKGSLTWNCATDENGVLYLADEDGNLPTDAADRKKPDISAKGSYTLSEVQAPDGYMTRTETGKDGTVSAVVMLTFDVDSDNQIKNVKCYTGTGELVTAEEPTISGDPSHPAGEHISLNVSVKNEKTKLSVAKRNDIESGTKTASQKSLNGERLSGAVLEIYEGTETGESGHRVAVLGNGQSEWNWEIPEGAADHASAVLAAGTLKENTIYTLHESSVPTGYLAADDIYFKLHGTITLDQTTTAQLYVWTGSGKPALEEGDGWTTTANLNQQVLTMVDEAIIAPVDLQKVTGENGSYQALAGALFEVRTADVILGTAVSEKEGYLVWKEIRAEGYASKLIFNADGKRVTDAGADGGSVIGKTIILQQNESGYTFTETYAPDQAYNDGRSYHVSITAENYLQYRGSRESGTQYHTDRYINLAEAEAAENHQAAQLSVKSQKTTYQGYADVDESCSSDKDVGRKLAVNLPYQSSVTLHKYDGDEEGQRAAIADTKFTLYRGRVSDSTVYKKAYSVGADQTLEQNETGVFTTDADGNIFIEIHEKGTYILKETGASAGYRLDGDTNTFTFVLADQAAGENEEKTAFGYHETNELRKDEYGVSNQRVMGEVSLTKTDAVTGETLDGVVYTLTRTDIPKAAPDAENSENGTDLTEYLLKVPADVVTGKSYQAEKVNGIWQLTEITDAAQCRPGEIHISGLNWGSYTLTEKQELSGYKLEKNADGESKNTHTFTVDGTKNQLTFRYSDQNEKNRVTFYKTNQIDAEAGVSAGDIRGLDGAVFETHEGDGSDCEVDADGNTSCTKASFYTSDRDKNSADNLKTTVVTGEDGKVTIYGLPTNTGEDEANPGNSKTYHLVEVKAPKGYKLQTAPVVFTIDRQGKVQIKNADGSYEDAAPAGTVKMENEAIKLYVQKLGEDDSTWLTGAEFKLTDVCSDGSGDPSCDQ